MRTIIEKSFKKQRKFLESNVEDLYKNYKYNIEILRNLLNDEHVHIYQEKKERYEVENNDPLGGFRMEMGVEDMINEMRPQVERAVEKGYKRSFRLHEKLLAENGFRYYTDVISNYMNKRGELNLSNYRGSISRTTKYDVIKVLKNGIDNNLTPGEVAEQITAIDEKLFSKARADTISITEMGKAYEYGNYMPIEQLESVGVQMEKKRETVHDSRVRPEHMECEMEGRVRSDYVYPSVGVDIPPGGPNCRCTILYRRAQ